MEAELVTNYSHCTKVKELLLWCLVQLTIIIVPGAILILYNSVFAKCRSASMAAGVRSTSV